MVGWGSLSRRVDTTIGIDLALNNSGYSHVLPARPFDESEDYSGNSEIQLGDGRRKRTDQWDRD
jgi:hypothetical protein